MAAHPDNCHTQLVREIAAFEGRPLPVARDEHSGVAVHLGVDLVVGVVIDLVRPRGGLEECLPVELARGALE